MIFKRKNRRRERRRNEIQQRVDYKQQQSFGNRSGSVQSTKQIVNDSMSTSISYPRLLFLVPVIFVIGYVLYASQNPIIRIPDSARPTQEVSVYRSSVEEAIKSTYLNRTKLTFNYSEISRSLREKHPEIASVAISFAPFGDQAVVSLDFYEPEMIALSRGKEWIIDSRGVAISELSTEQLRQRYVSFLRIRDDIGLVQRNGDSLMSADDIIFVANALEYFEIEGYDVDSTTLPNNPRELVIRLKNVGYLIRLNLDNDPREQVGTAIASIESLRAASLTPSEYIDVRPGEKVYWR